MRVGEHRNRFRLQGASIAHENDRLLQPSHVMHVRHTVPVRNDYPRIVEQKARTVRAPRGGGGMAFDNLHTDNSQSKVVDGWVYRISRRLFPRLRRPAGTQSHRQLLQETLK